MDNVQIYQRHDGRWAWRRRTPQGQIIATDGSQGYENKQDCCDLAERVNGPDVEYEMVEPS